MTDDERQYNLLCPNKHEIRGTVEMIYGTAFIDEGSIRPSDDKDNKYGFDFEWDGETDVNYDSEETVEVEGVRQFVCDEYCGQFGENELTFVVMDEESGEWVAPTKELGLLQSHDTPAQGANTE